MTSSCRVPSADTGSVVSTLPTATTFAISVASDAGIVVNAPTPLSIGSPQFPAAVTNRTFGKRRMSRFHSSVAGSMSLNPVLAASAQEMFVPAEMFTTIGWLVPMDWRIVATRALSMVMPFGVMAS
ncbi:MAG: hypothetical protein H6734_11420 [Alphaproteobacteria bacterium]|nr:hypothetical protein [Alphaproteobacteria bacterium]